uniref:C2 domain-containing protein n=1 Tax=Ciona savignyi TaxID=51511 RepID=H2Y6V2_CIOSA
MACKVELRVYDRDRAFTDDFMGAAEIDLASLTPTSEEVNLHLADENLNEELGYINLHASVVPLSPDLGVTVATQVNSRLPHKLTVGCHAGIRGQRTIFPVAVATVQLVSGSNLPARDANGFSDPYVKFTMGKAKKKSKVGSYAGQVFVIFTMYFSNFCAISQKVVCYKTLNPVWKDEFIFQLFNNESSTLDVTVWDKDNYRKDDFIGRCELNLWDIEREVTHSLQLGLLDTPGNLLFLITIHDIEPRENSLTSYDLSNLRTRYVIAIPILRGVNGVERTYALKDRKLKERTKGTVTIQISYIYNPIRAAIRTLSPREEKYMEEDLKFKKNLLLSNFQRVWRLMQSIIATAEFINSCFTWVNPRRSAVAFMLSAVNSEFLFRIVCLGLSSFRMLICRLYLGCLLNITLKSTTVGTIFSSTFHATPTVHECCPRLNDKSLPQNKLQAFLVIVWNFELYMLPISLLMLLMKTYVDVFVRNQPLAAVESWFSVVPLRPDMFHLMPGFRLGSENDDDDVDEELSSNKPSLLQRLSALQEVLTKVQNILDFIASFGERVKNTFAWRVPFLSWLAVCVLCVVAVVLYYFPLRGIVLLWGINKFTKRLRKPNFVPNNEVMDFLSRVPSNVQIDDYREIPIEQGSPKNCKKKR